MLACSRKHPLDVASPPCSSPNFRQWLPLREVAALTAPLAASVAAVAKWFLGGGVSCVAEHAQLRCEGPVSKVSSIRPRSHPPSCPLHQRCPRVSLADRGSLRHACVPVLRRAFAGRSVAPREARGPPYATNSPHRRRPRPLLHAGVGNGAIPARLLRIPLSLLLLQLADFPVHARLGAAEAPQHRTGGGRSLSADLIV